MAVTGDFDKLRKWQEAFESLAADEMRREASGDMAMEAIQHADMGFTKEEDPYGNPWLPKARPNGLKVLEGKTKDLRHNFKISDVSEHAFKISNSTRYFKIQQHGGYNNKGHFVPARPMLPVDGKLPPVLVTKFTNIYHKHCLLRLSKI